jgi:transcriptional/translational regulatory protein YebC/TACO1
MYLLHVLLLHAQAAAGIVGEPSLAHIPNALVECSDADIDKNLAAIEALEALEDVDQVEHNMA